VKWYGKYGRKASWIVKRNGKVGWIVKLYGKYRRKVSWIGNRNGKYEKNVTWKVKRFGK
jgi:hypothetical protein